MCIMEVRAGQRTSTIAQAMAHNVKTITSDQDMLMAVLEARDEKELLAHVREAQKHLQLAYERFLHCYAVAVEEDVIHGRGQPLGEQVGSEREAIVGAYRNHRHLSEDDFHEAATAAAEAATRYETR